MPSIEIRFVIGPSDILFEGIHVCMHFLSPEILPAGAVNELTDSQLVKIMMQHFTQWYWIQYSSSRQDFYFRMSVVQ